MRAVTFCKPFAAVFSALNRVGSEAVLARTDNVVDDGLRDNAVCPVARL